jgi:Protein of unknown function (DUF4031)
MAVYVDDMNLPPEVRNGPRVVRGRWSHLFADTERELRDFARFIGLRAAWIQHPGTNRVHFDVTRSKRALAISYGAQPVTWREAGEILAAREAGGLYVPLARRGQRERATAQAPAPRRRAAPERPGPGCGTTELTHGREVCQACGLLQTLAAREAQPSAGPVWPQIEAGS